MKTSAMPLLNSREAGTIPHENRNNIRKFFEAIAGRYDLLNELLSLRLDERWRKQSCKILLEGHERAILDLGVGTGKFLKLFCGRQPWDNAVGLDFAENMLAEAQKNLKSKAVLVKGDFEALPFREESFDLVVSSFTLRSVQNMKVFLRGVYDVLKPGGKAGFLCLTRPQSGLCGLLYRPYMKWYLPFLGGLISGNRQAYEFLSDSVMRFQEPSRTMEMMLQTGFRTAEMRQFSFGLATLIWARK